MKRPTITSSPEGTNQRGVDADRAGDTLDLRGVRCPLNWVKAKIHLERLSVGDLLHVLVDDPKGARDIPRAAEAEGYAVVGLRVEAIGWSILIEK